MRLEVVCALFMIAVFTIGTSAEDSGSQNDVDDERSVRDAFDDDEGQSVLGDDGRSVRDADRDKDDRCKACYKCRGRHLRVRCISLCRGCKVSACTPCTRCFYMYFIRRA